MLETFLTTTCDLQQQHEVMSSDGWVEPCSEGRAKETKLGKQQEEEAVKEEAEVPCGDNQPAGSLRQEEEPGGERPLAPDHSGMLKVTSAGGLEQVQKEETQTQGRRQRFSHMTLNRESQVSGAHLVERYLRRSFPRGLSTCTYPDRDRERQTEEPRGPGPFYFFGGTNGAEIVSSYFESRGWKRIYNKNRADFKLKWCTTKSPANNFREGEQLVYQIPNNNLTTKIGLLSSLREYERVTSRVKHGRGLRRLKMEEFIPTTFRMDVREEREAFFAQQNGPDKITKGTCCCHRDESAEGRAEAQTRGETLDRSCRSTEQD